MGIDILNYGQTDADILLIQMVDEHDLEVIENEVKHIRKLSGNRKFCLKAVKVKSWNRDLSPWSAPAVFGNEDFGKGAPETLQYLQEKVLPSAGDKTALPPYPHLSGFPALRSTCGRTVSAPMLFT